MGMYCHGYSNEVHAVQCGVVQNRSAYCRTCLPSSHQALARGLRRRRMRQRGRGGDGGRGGILAGGRPVGHLRPHPTGHGALRHGCGIRGGSSIPHRTGHTIVRHTGRARQHPCGSRGRCRSGRSRGRGRCSRSRGRSGPSGSGRRAEFRRHSRRYSGRRYISMRRLEVALLL